METILGRAEAQLLAWSRRGLQPLINATGVILHTNLGRAPLSRAAVEAMGAVAQAYSNLEFDLETGKRSQRLLQAEEALGRLTRMEAAMIVNNNAAAVLLALSALGRRKRVLVARSQLVEIGGGFRMPDIMKQSAAKLVEVGTTNRVRLEDYEQEFAESAIVLKAHRSNFKMTGFVEEPDLRHIAEAAHRAGLIVIDDLGSGALLDTAEYGLAHEPTVQESVAAGADLICFSGDKLLGGPQAGIVIGKAELMAKLRRHPLARAVRADKVSLAGLTATLNHYLRNEAEREIPVWRMISIPLNLIERRTQIWAERLGQGEVCKGESTLGGGSLPGESLPTYVLSLDVKSSSEFLRRLRLQDPPIVARTEKGRVLLDSRTVLEGQDQALLAGLGLLLRESE
jgi:L-seryl-tRNA(Ser) seleniumtransferase